MQKQLFSLNSDIHTETKSRNALQYEDRRDRALIFIKYHWNSLTIKLLPVYTCPAYGDSRAPFVFTASKPPSSESVDVAR